MMGWIDAVTCMSILTFGRENLTVAHGVEEGREPKIRGRVTLFSSQGERMPSGGLGSREPKPQSWLEPCCSPGGTGLVRGACGLWAHGSALCGDYG